MLLSVLLALIMIVGMVLLLFSAVALIQDRRFFTTAPKDIQEAVLDHPERFPGAHALGYALAVCGLALIAGAFVYGAYDGIRNGFSFWQLFLRFLVILYLWKAFDMICFDRLLLTRSHFFQHYYPETEGCAGYSQPDFNRKEQLIRIAAFPFVAALLAGIAVLIGG